MKETMDLALKVAVNERRVDQYIREHRILKKDLQMCKIRFEVIRDNIKVLKLLLAHIPAPTQLLGDWERNLLRDLCKIMCAHISLVLVIWQRELRQSGLFTSYQENLVILENLLAQAERELYG